MIVLLVPNLLSYVAFRVCAAVYTLRNLSLRHTLHELNLDEHIVCCCCDNKLISHKISLTSRLCSFSLSSLDILSDKKTSFRPYYIIALRIYAIMGFKGN